MADSLFELIAAFKSGPYSKPAQVAELNLNYGLS
jgi:hypothetical protein